MASHVDAPREQTDSSERQSEEIGDRIEAHLISALDSSTDDQARYHLREALQLQVADMHGPS